ncbi:hypothetical protein AB7M23_003648 [Pseudomonas sp. HLS-6 TE3448]
MSLTTLTQARHTGRLAQPLLAIAECGTCAPASFYFGYWFSQRRR